VTFVIPPWFTRELPPGSYEFSGTGGFKGPAGEVVLSTTSVEWVIALLHAEAQYLQLTEFGQVAQQARAVLPNSLKTEICVKANTREWMHIFSQRCAPSAHPQMVELMVPLAKEFNRRCPVLYEEWA